MAYVKVMIGNVSKFVEESKVSRLTTLKNNFNAEPVKDASGKIKKYSQDDISASLKRGKESAESIFG